MLIAFISDIHGNQPALEAAVADAKKRGAGKIVCAGDMTGYGPNPDEVCRFLKNRHYAAIIGNYDRKVIDVIKRGKSSTAKMKKQKRKILLWTVKRISRQNQLYLSDLPAQLDLELPGGRKLLMVHGSPISVDDTIYPSVTKAGIEVKLGEARPDVLICGHTHIPFVKRIDGFLLVNCGSVGHPVDGDPRPSYALVRAERYAVPMGYIVRFDYDRDRMIKALRKTSLPKELRKDFTEGVKGRFLE